MHFVNNGTGTILVVDDDVDTLRLLETILVRAGYSVIATVDGTLAIQRAQSDNIDLILLDGIMPNMDGYEVCRQIRQHRECQDVPIVFISALDTPNDKVQAFGAGAVDFICKPVEPVELLARVRTHLAISRIHRNTKLENTLAIDSMQSRLGQVRRGQERIFTSPAGFPSLQLAIRFQTALEAGGDFYDIRQLADDEFGFIVADVSGHDLGIAYLTGALKALTASFINDGLSVQETMIMFNGALLNFLEPDQYVTACYARFCRNSMKLDVISAAHPSPLIQKAGGETYYLNLRGDVLGMFDTVTCDAQSITVQPKDRVFLFTDGLVEHFPCDDKSDGNRLQGYRCLADTMTRLQKFPIQKAVDLIVDDLVGQCHGTVEDDVILLGIEF